MEHHTGSPGNGHQRKTKFMIIGVLTLVASITLATVFWPSPSDTPAVGTSGSPGAPDLETAAPSAGNDADSQFADSSAPALPVESADGRGATAGESAPAADSARPANGQQQIGQVGQAAPALGSTAAVTISTQPTSEALKDAPKPVCHTMEFKHEHLRAHDSGEPCLEHRNVLTLKEDSLNPKSVCVRVNGKAIQHQVVRNPKVANEWKVVFGPHAGPNAVVTTTYCSIGAQCSEGCKIPRDDFMEAIGGGVGSLDGNLPAVSWDATGKEKKIGKTEENLDRELKDFTAVMKKSDTQNSDLFAGWVNEKTQVSCFGTGYALLAKPVTGRR